MIYLEVGCIARTLSSQQQHLDIKAQSIPLKETIFDGAKADKARSSISKSCYTMVGSVRPNSIIPDSSRSGSSWYWLVVPWRPFQGRVIGRVCSGSLVTGQTYVGPDFAQSYLVLIFAKLGVARLPSCESRQKSRISGSLLTVLLDLLPST